MHIFPQSVARLVAAVLVSSQLVACFPAVVGGAAAGGVMAADRRTSGIYIEDQAIELKAKKMIIDNIGAANINVSVTSFNLNVLLTGEAIDEATREKAERAARSIDNVKTVTNELAISEKSGLGTSASDTYITSKVKANMVKENLFPANYVKVVTENSIVYLMGMVTRKEAEDAVEIARGISGVEKVVKVFEYID
ncbi:Osmotically-inducible protein Y [Methylophilaceae bacterium]|nr:Osmotically-inducible protein Y [Methylophilaceae bacterium]